MFYYLIKIWLLDDDIKCRGRAIAQKLRICSTALQSWCSLWHISAQHAQLQQQVGQRTRFTGLWDPTCEHLLSSIAFRVRCSLTSSLLSSAHHVSKRAHFHGWLASWAGLTELNEGIFWFQGAKCRVTMQGSHAAPQWAAGLMERVGMEQTGQGCGLSRKNHNSIRVTSSRGAQWVAATEPLFHSSSLLNPCPTSRRCQKEKVPSVHGFFVCFVCFFLMWT